MENGIVSRFLCSANIELCLIYFPFMLYIVRLKIDRCMYSLHREMLKQWHFFCPIFHWQKVTCWLNAETFFSNSLILSFPIDVQRQRISSIALEFMNLPSDFYYSYSHTYWKNVTDINTMIVIIGLFVSQEKHLWLSGALFADVVCDPAKIWTHTKLCVCVTLFFFAFTLLQVRWALPIPLSM